MKSLRGITLALATVAVLATSVAAQRRPGQPRYEAVSTTLGDVSIQQKLDSQVPLKAQFKDESGSTVELGKYFGHGKAVILNLVYYECPMLCTEVLNGLTSTLRTLKLDVGKDFEVLTVSFDPRETPALAAKKKQAYLERYGRQGASSGWHFLTGDKENIAKLTESVGFRFAWDDKTQQWAHGAAIMILTPKGRVAQYYYGVEYPPKDLRLGLVEASENRIGNLVDEVLLYCYHYDPRTGRYGAVVTRILQLSAAATTLILGGFMIVMFRRDKKQGPNKTPRAA